jgi:hypothetical protein
MAGYLNYKYLFAFIVAFYCLVLSQFGFENFDTGYIPSFSWRIVNGESVYEDFIYKGPPVTLYFHALFMEILPETGQFFFIRIIAYLLFGLQVILFVCGFDNIYDLAKYRIDKWGMICVGFVISLLNFSPYPWPTTDGLLFAAIAFWLVSKSKSAGFLLLSAIALLTVLSALTKQSFYLVPGFFLFWIYIKYGLQKAVILLLLVLAFVALYLSFILSITDWNNFIHQTTGQTPLLYLYYTGIHNYIFVSVTWFAILILLFLAVFFAYRLTKKQKISISPLLKWISLALFAIAIGASFCGEVRFASRIGFDAALIGLGYASLARRNLPQLAPIMVAMGIAWSSSISLGYQYPILFATGIILCFMLLIGKNLNINSKLYFWIAWPICLISFAYNYMPYRETDISTLKYSLENVSSKLKYIKTNKASFEKYSELKNLVSKYGENFIVAPNIPMANYLFNDQSELPADWIIETEIDNQQNRFIKLASDKKNYIFMEKSFLNHELYVQQKLEDFSSISVFICNNFNLIDETKHFRIYNALKER